MRYAFTKTGEELHLAKYTRYGRMTRKTLCGKKSSVTFSTKRYSGPTCLKCDAAYDRERSREFG